MARSLLEVHTIRLPTHGRVLTLFAVIAVILTLILSIFGIVTHHRSTTPLSGSTIKTVLRVGIEFVVLLVYIASAGLMLRPRTGCTPSVDPPKDNWCGVPNGDPPVNGVQPLNFVAPYDAQPLSEWNAAIAFSFLEM